MDKVLQNVAAVAALCVSMVVGSMAMAQPGPLPAMRIRAGGFGRAAIAAPGTVETAKDEEGFADGATLKTDPEAQQLLGRAEQFVTDERYDLAAVLWQKVLDDAGDSLVLVDPEKGLYISLRRQVEQRLTELPKIALSTYRVTADGEAQATISKAGPEKEEEALSEVVRRFFMSSLGDDAAYKLGCLALDRYDFVGASRMFSKVLEEHPDATIPRADLLVRLAVAAARVGDRDGASKYLAQIEEAEGPKPGRTLLSQVGEDIEQSTAGQQFVAARLAMPALPPAATAETLTSLWAHEYVMEFQDQPLNRNMIYAYSGRVQPVEKRTISRDQVIDRWKENGWLPAGKLLIHEGRVFFKTNKSLTCWSTEGNDKIVWESLWYNDYEVDEFSQQLAMWAMNMGYQPGTMQDNRPRTPAEMLLFGDRIHQDMSISHGKVFSIEGRNYPKRGTPDLVVKQPKPINYQSTPRRTRVNFLAAYDVATGKLQWHRGADDEAKDGSDGGMGFMAAPSPCGSMLLVPVTDGGSMWLYGISPTDGKTQWKTYLCDEPPGGCEPWSPIKVAAEGRDAYVLCGAGVLFALDGTSGAIRWVIRYNRDEKPLSTRMVRNPYGGRGQLKEYNGWSEEMLIPVGRQLLVMASDRDKLMAYDCRSGEFLWDSPRTLPTGPEVSYCVGVKGRGLFVAGRNQVRRIDIPSGKIIWQYPDEGQSIDSLGRAVLTDDALYLPVKDSVVKLDLEKGKELAQVGVRLTTPDPVGNLYSDGEKLWVLSANRFYSLTHLDYLMKSLQKRIDAGDSAALLDRMRLHVKSEAWEPALKDLGDAYTLIRSQKDQETAASAVFSTLDELKLPAEQPKFILSALTRLFSEDAASLKPDLRVKLEGMMSSTLSAIGREKQAGIAAEVLAAAPMMKQDFLIQSAARVVKSVATADDKAALAAAVTGGKEPVSLIAVEAWAILDPEAARPALQPLLGSGDAKVKLLMARSLLHTGDKDALATLVELLSSDDLQTRIRSYQTLRAATAKTDLPFTPYAAEAERGKQATAWKDWYATSKDTLKLVLPIPESAALIGRTLVCQHGRNQVIEIDANFKEIKRHSVAQPWSAKGLPNGNRLVAMTSQNRLVEYDDQWKAVWSVDGLPSGSWSVDRGLDGNTLVACGDGSNPGQILEISPSKDKKVIWKSDAGTRPVFVNRLENGNTLICVNGSNKVVEIDGSGKVVWEISSLANPYSAQRLPNGNTLIAAMMTGANGLIVEVDRGGRQVKVAKQGLRQLYGAERLENGNLIYVDNQGLHEIDADGKSLYSRRETGITGFSRF